MKTTTLLSTLAALLAVPLGTSAQTIVNITPSADTNVRQYADDAATNYGTQNLSIRGAGSSYNRYSYLQFDLSSFTDSDPIISATLTLTLSSAIDSGRTESTLYLYGLSYASDAETKANVPQLQATAEDDVVNPPTLLTNENAPWKAVRNTLFSPPTNATSLGSVTIPAPGTTGSAAGKPIELLSTSALVSFLETARLNPSLSIVTLVFLETSTQSKEINFYSSEHSTESRRPTLTITTAPIPEPATVAALASTAVLVLAAALRRRR
ncbi:PEP-CTERM putative exosortase interaction domain-containing protein [Opitutaceae bacterium TAV1]|nr:PEP-CTERM putative exosortase interaction domain-containing protein [Opitutaceae bacterium TAV1]